MSLKNSLIVLWVYILYVLGIWLFLSGFLLKRIVIHQYSNVETNVGVDINCKDIMSLRYVADSGMNKINNPATNITHLQRFNKAIILLIDGLRYDFTNSEKKFVSTHDDYYSNKMPIFRQTLEKKKDHAMLFRLLADPPTTTLQRLTGITTGSLPTFIDVSLNFAGYEIKEDNIIYQIKNIGKAMTFMGDDTWEVIFPNYFKRSYPYPSFNVKDLDTVDDGIVTHLYNEIRNKDSDVVIAHFLGVDHCGHWYGPKHPEMSRKLIQMNKVIEKVIEEIKEDTILMVLGDHGMTESGDHGGDSLQEITTALFLYSRIKLLEPLPERIDNIPTVPQVSIVPTLSLLLGLPIPFSNLGSIIDQVFTLNFKNVCFHPKLDPLIGKALAAAENSLQINRYLRAYGEISSELPKSFIFETEQKLKNVTMLWNNITHDLLENTKILHHILNGYKEFLHNVRITCAEKWATFNIEYMIAGCVILLFAVICNLLVAHKLEVKHYLFIASGLIISISIAMIYLFNLFNFYIWPFVVIIIYFCLKLLKRIPEEYLEFITETVSIPSVILIVLFFINFSNSFVVYEDSAVMYLLQSVILCRFWPHIAESLKTFSIFFNAKSKSSKRSPKFNWRNCLQPLYLLCLVLCIRMSSAFHKCREEQIACSNSDFIISLEKLHLSKTYKGTRLIISLLSVIIPSVIFFGMMSYRYLGKLQSVSAISIKYGTFFICVLTSLRWWLNIIPPNIIERVLQGHEVFLTRSSFLLSILMCILIILLPFLTEKPWLTQSKEIYHGSFLSLLFGVIQLLQLIVGDALSTGVMLMSLSTLFYIILINSSPHAETWIWTDVIIWYLLSCHWFYGTAHQPTFTAIQWDAAFLINYNEVYSYILSGILVILNTFCSNVFYGLALPVLLTCTDSSIFTSKSLLRLHMKYSLCFGLKLLGSIFASFILRRHLMVWKIFSPKLLYEVLGFFITMLFSSIGHYFLMRISSHYHNLIRLNLKQVFE